MIKTVGLTELPVGSFISEEEHCYDSPSAVLTCALYAVVEYFKWATDVMWRCSFMIMMQS